MSYCDHPPSGVEYPSSYHCLICAPRSWAPHATRSDTGTFVNPEGAADHPDLVRVPAWRPSERDHGPGLAQGTSDSGRWLAVPVRAGRGVGQAGLGNENCRPATSAMAAGRRLMYMPLRSPGVTDHQRAEADQFVSYLFRAYSPALLRLALLLVGDQPSAEDVVQEAFIGLHRARLRDQDKALPYLRVAVVNGCRSAHRARRRATALRPQHEPPVWSAEAAAIAREDRREVLAAVAR